MKEDIVNKIKSLIGLLLRQAGRAGNLIWLQFGEIDAVIQNGREKRISQYSINIQCACRIKKDSKIVVASRDKYVPSKLYTGDLDDFYWDVVGMNRLDQKLNENINLLDTELIVESVDADDCGGALILFSSGYQLEIFPDESTDEEFWRLIQRDDQTHFIVTGNGIELV